MASALITDREALPQLPVEVWQQRVDRAAPPYATSRFVDRLRVLANGTVAALGRDANAVTLLRYSLGSGTLLGSLTTVERGVAWAEIDPAGDLFLVSQVFRAGWEISVTKRSGSGNDRIWPSDAILASPVGGSIWVRDVAIDHRGDLVLATVAGSWTESLSAALFKLDGRTGERLWGPVVVTGIADGDEPIVLRVDATGKVILAATFKSSSPFVDLLGAAAFDGNDGRLLWGPIGAGRDGNDQVSDAAIDPNGDVLISGRLGGAQATYKYSGSGGALLWGPVLEATRAGRGKILVDRRGDVIVVAADRAADEVPLFKYDGRTGGRLWGPIAGQGVSLTPDVLAAGADGTLFAAGAVSRICCTTDIATLAVDGRDGTLRWGPVYYAGPRALSDTVHALCVDPDGGVLVAGGADYEHLMVTLRYDARSGAPLWEPRQFTGDVTSGPKPSSTVRDPAGDLLAAGYVGGGLGALVKLQGRSGRVIWGPVPLEPHDNSVTQPVLLAGAGGVPVVLRPYYGGTIVQAFQAADGASSWTRGLSLQFCAGAVGASGDVLVAGLADGSRFTALKLRASDGSTLWGPVEIAAFAGVAPAAAAIDGHGDLVVAGRRDRSAAVVKVRGADGTRLWGPTLLRVSADSLDGADLLSLDASEDAVIAGTSSRGTAWLLAARVRGTDGTPIWGPVTSERWGTLALANDLVLDALGNAIVAGGVTLKFDSRTGAELWKRPAPSATGAALGERGELFLASSASSAYPGRTFELSLRRVDPASGSTVWQVSGPEVGMGSVLLEATGGDPVAFASTADLNQRLLAVRYTDGLSLAVGTPAPLVTWCGRPTAIALASVNGTPPVLVRVASGTLPPGLRLDETGLLSGTTTAPGDYSLTLRLEDGAGRMVLRDVVVRVLARSGTTEIRAEAVPPCTGPGRVLSVSGHHGSLLWYPGGETTPSITVSPFERTTYGVVASQGTCVAEGYLEVEPWADLPVPSLAAPAKVLAGASNLVATATPREGSEYLWSISNGAIDGGAGGPEVRFTAGDPGPLRLTVIEKDGNGCSRPAATRDVQVVASLDGTLFHTVSPCRIYDTRRYGYGPIQLGSSSLIWLIGDCGIPYSARSVAVNVTVTEATSRGELRIAPGRSPDRPESSVLSFPAGSARSGNAIIVLPSNGEGVVTVWSSGTGQAHLLVDVVGYFE